MMPALSIRPSAFSACAGLPMVLPCPGRRAQRIRAAHRQSIRLRCRSGKCAAHLRSPPLNRSPIRADAARDRVGLRAARPAFVHARIEYRYVVDSVARCRRCGLLLR